jgi:hypothetical protein
MSKFYEYAMNMSLCVLRKKTNEKLKLCSTGVSHQPNTRRHKIYIFLEHFDKMHAKNKSFYGEKQQNILSLHW